MNLSIPPFVLKSTTSSQSRPGTPISGLCTLAAFLLGGLLPLDLIAQTEGELGEYGPPEAFVPGNPHPYFGSENPWNRRMFSQRPADLFYKRRGQRQILAILEGDPGQAVAWASARIAADGYDLESRFLLSIAYAQLGELDLAIRAMRDALGAGLPFERYLGGPRDLIAPLAETTAFQELRQHLALRMVHGPMLGDMSDTQVRVRVRTVNEALVEVEAVPLDNPDARIDRTRFRTNAMDDFSGVGLLDELKPSTTYRYHIKVDGTPVESAGSLQFRTFPSPASTGEVKVVFGGCAGYTPEHERIWSTITRTRPNAVMLLGDNVYLDVPGAPSDFHRYTYHRRQTRPEFSRLASSLPIYAIWDDHDAGMDDLWLGPYPNQPGWKRANLDFFLQNWVNPPVQNAERPGVWHQWRVGGAEFFMLDARSYRTNPFEASRTMLGPEQKRWLFDALRRSTATFKFIVSPVNWVLGSKEGSRDTWQGYPGERAEIFDFLSEHSIDGVVLISSDRHRSDVWVNERSGDYPLHEFGSGYLTNTHTHPEAADAVFSYNDKNSFAVLRIDTAQPDPTVSCDYLNIDGEVVYSRTLRLSELSSAGNLATGSGF